MLTVGEKGDEGGSIGGGGEGLIEEGEAMEDPIADPGSASIQGAETCRAAGDVF